MTIQEIADNITNVRYFDADLIAFDYCGEVIKIKAPHDVMLVGANGAAMWLAKHYGVLLALSKE